MKKIIISLFLVLSLSSCCNSPTDDVIQIIESTKADLYKAKSSEELQNMHHVLLNRVTNCLNEQHNRYRFIRDNEEYKKVSDCFKLYNICFCKSISKYTPELDYETGNQEIVAKFLALMMVMEEAALTEPNGYNPQKEDSNEDKNKINNNNDVVRKGSDILPTTEEIQSVKERLPVMVNEITKWYDIEYDENKLIQTFSYKYTQEIDKSLITDESLKALKGNIIAELEQTGGVKRIQMGVTYIYKYYDVNDRLLYEIKIQSSDLN